MKVGENAYLQFIMECKFILVRVTVAVAWLLELVSLSRIHVGFWRIKRMILIKLIHSNSCKSIAHRRRIKRPQSCLQTKMRLLFLQKKSVYAPSSWPVKTSPSISHHITVDKSLSGRSTHFAITTAKRNWMAKWNFLDLCPLRLFFSRIIYATRFCLG